MAFCLLSSGVALADEPPGKAMKLLTGEVWYRERMLLPPGSELMIALQDVAKMDVKAEVIASERLPLEGAPPYPFKLSYDASKLHQRGQYALLARIENNGQLLFINTERIPAFAESPVSVRLDRVAGSRPNADNERRPDASLTDTYWKLVEMDDHRILTSEGQRETHFVLETDGGLHGFAGCNRIRGRYELDGERLQFPPVMVTRKACFPGMQKETAFLARLQEVQHYGIAGDSLALYGGDGRLILRFEAVYLN